MALAMLTLAQALQRSDGSIVMQTRTYVVLMLYLCCTYVFKGHGFVQVNETVPR